MGSVLLYMLFVFVVGVFVCGTVLVGMVGKGSERHPKVARGMARAAEAMNGESEPPRTLVKLLR